MQTPREFITKWKASSLKERSASQEHFLDLCHLIGHPSPAQLDPTGDFFTFERGAAKTGSGQGWADVWKKGCFAWEYKGKSKDLNSAFAQLQRYAIALENPPLLVVSDMNTIVIHTNWTNTVQEIHTFNIEDLERPEALQKISWAFNEPERFKPGVTREMVTEKAAATFAGIAQRLREAGHGGHQVAHFVNKLIFAMFAEDIGILPGQMLTRLVESVQQKPERLADKLKHLFSAMRTGGSFGIEEIPWFNGGLYDDDDSLPLDADSLSQLLKCARMDWSDIEPAIFGSLFERGLDPSKRSQLGAHYTDRDSIMRIVTPVVIEPLQREWDSIKAQIVVLQKKGTAPAKKKAENLYNAFMVKLRGIRVLDPACGSGNFLYLSLVTLKDFEHRVMIEAESLLNIHRDFPQIGPKNVLGIELNDYAAELARVSVWIGDIQWGVKNGMGYSQNPILQTLNTIENRDAVLNEDGTEAPWPAADRIVGNPPFLGDKRMITELGEEYVSQLRKVYAGRVPGGADLVTYWHEKSREAVASGQTSHVGLVSTNSIRGGASRKVLENIGESGRIYNAWGDEPWVNEGASVRVSLVCFDNGSQDLPVMLNGEPAAEIYPDLTARLEGASGMDMTTAKPLPENKGVSFIGTQKTGPFDIPGDLARQWLLLPSNPNGKSNNEVVRPWANGMDITRRPSDTWIIDFGCKMSEAEAAFFEAPFEYVVKEIKPLRIGKREEKANDKWWIHQRPRPDMRAAQVSISRYMVTPRVAKHRVFVWLDKSVLPDSRLNVICRDDDTAFGVLHSRFHEIWSLRTCSWHGVGNDPTYNAASCFETFPFPEGLTPNIKASDYSQNPKAQGIAEAARRLVELRDNWLNPSEWVTREPEVVPGYPERFVPVNEKVAVELKKRTLTNLYNLRPAWLDNAHRDLDKAVASAYGWDVNISDDEVLKELLKMNQERVKSL